MSLRIREDHARFKSIVRGKIRQNLRKYISSGELLGKQGKDVVSIPVPHIDIPRFRFGDKQQGGVGQGDGEVGESLGGEPQQGQGTGKAGGEQGEHVLEVDVDLAELAEILGEELALPHIQPKGAEHLEQRRDRYVSIRRVGPNALRHFKRTFRHAIRRQISTGTYDVKNPIVIPVRDDMRYRSWKTEKKPIANAVIIYMMDVSGSMGDEQKEIVRMESFWIDTWLKSQYKGLESRFIIHDAIAREVDRDTFFKTRESGGTIISSAYKLACQLIEQHYPPSDWNIYPFHFSDGDNWSVDDTLQCVDILEQRLLPASNVFCYGQVESPYGSGQFLKDLRQRMGQSEKVILSEIRDRDAIVDSIRAFLGTGK